MLARLDFISPGDIKGSDCRYHHWRFSAKGAAVQQFAAA